VLFESTCDRDVRIFEKAAIGVLWPIPWMGNQIGGGGGTSTTQGGKAFGRVQLDVFRVGALECFAAWPVGHVLASAFGRGSALIWLDV